MTGTVQFYDLNNDDFPATATLDGTGNYTVNLPAGSYAVLTQNTQGHVNEIWPNVSCSAVCDVGSIVPIDITTNAVTDIDFVLDPGGRVSGTVTSTSTGLPLAGVTVSLIDAGETVPFTKGVTDVNGFFTSEGGTVAGNLYAVTWNQIGYQNELFDNVKCEDCEPSASGGSLFVVAGSGTTGGLNFALDPGGVVSGTVTDGNGVPLSNVIVSFETADFSFSFGAVTDASGHYTTGGQVAGTYYPHTINHQGYVDKAYGDVICHQDYCNAVAVGAPVSVVVGATTSNINFSLPAGGRISGAVTNVAGGAPVPINSGNAAIAIFNSAGVFVTPTLTDGAGLYETPYLPPGTYYLQTQNVPGFGNQLYNAIGCSGCLVLTGTPVTVTAGNTTGAVDFPLASSGSISGTVTNAVGGAAINGASVQVFSSTGAGIGNTTTNASGVYTLSGLAPGSYYVRTNQGGSFINEIYNDIPCQQCNVTASGAALVAVVSGTTTSNIDFALATGGRISGFVTNASGGAAIQSVAVQLFNSQSVSMGQVNTQANGSYITAGLPAGTYYVRTNNTLGFINELYNDIPCPITVCQASDGAPITVNVGVTTSAINFALTATGGKISGTVTNAGGAPLQNVTVQTYNTLGRFLGGVQTDASGNYSTQSLPDGTYYLRAANSLGYIDQVYDGESCLAQCQPLTGTPVNVAGSRGHRKEFCPVARRLPRWNHPGRRHARAVAECRRRRLPLERSADQGRNDHRQRYVHRERIVCRNVFHQNRQQLRVSGRHLQQHDVLRGDVPGHGRDGGRGHGREHDRQRRLQPDAGSRKDAERQFPEWAHELGDLRVTQQSRRSDLEIRQQRVPVLPGEWLPIRRRAPEHRGVIRRRSGDPRAVRRGQYQ